MFCFNAETMDLCLETNANFHEKTKIFLKIVEHSQ